MVDTIHQPVLKDEILHWLSPKANGVYVDATLGLGGHTEALLKHDAGVGKVVGFEWDEAAADLAQKRLEHFGSRFSLVRASYTDIAGELLKIGLSGIDGLVADLGVSSLQLDHAERGFTFRENAHLDMRMDRRRGQKASSLIATLSEEDLADIFFHYGEERQARRIARFIVEARAMEAVETTAQLAEIVKRAVPLKYHPKKIHVATKVFQALRVAVNREFENITSLLDSVPALLKPSARLCIISFHSIEDRIVKQAFNRNQLCKVIVKKPVIASEQEIRSNPRSRSAKLRVAERQAN